MLNWRKLLSPVNLDEKVSGPKILSFHYLGLHVIRNADDVSHERLR
jgi:hypothetical protein